MTGHAYTPASTLHVSPITMPISPRRPSLLRPLLTALTLLAGSGVGHGAATERTPLRPLTLSTTAATDEARVIVKFRTTRLATAMATPSGGSTTDVAPPRRAQALGQRVGLTLADGPGVGSDMQVVRARGMSSAALASKLAADSQVEYAVEDRRRLPHAVVSDPLYGVTVGGSPSAGQWYLRAPTVATPAAANVEGAWNVTTGSAGVVVAVLDSGVRRLHPDLDGKLLPGYDFIDEPIVSNDGNGRDSNPSDPGDWVSSSDTRAYPTTLDCGTSDSSWHGTQMAGLIAAATNNGTGMAGVGRHVRVLPVRVLGKCGGYDSDIVAAMRWAAGLHVDGVPDNPNPARVLNLSLGFEGNCTVTASTAASDPARLYTDTINELTSRGVAVVSSAGNDSKAVNLPANCPGVIAVGAVRHSGTKAGYSSLGTQVALSAPGGNCVNADAGSECLYPILSTTNSGTTSPSCSTYTTGSGSHGVGTSYAAPQVAGTIALMLSARPSLTLAQITSLLRSTARPFPTSGGADAAVRACSSTTSTVQEECYCTTATCGAGLLDAAAAVRAAAGAMPVARLGDAATRVLQGGTLALDAIGSSATTGQSISGYQWRLTGGTTLASFNGTTGASTAALTASGSGLVTVELSVSDSSGAIGTSSAVIRTGAAPAATCGTDATDDAGTPASSGGGGGGAMDLRWLAGLAAAVLVLAGLNRRAARA